MMNVRSTANTSSTIDNVPNRILRHVVDATIIKVCIRQTLLRFIHRRQKEISYRSISKKAKKSLFCFLQIHLFRIKFFF